MEQIEGGDIRRAEVRQRVRARRVRRVRGRQRGALRVVGIGRAVRHAGGERLNEGGRRKPRWQAGARGSH